MLEHNPLCQAFPSSIKLLPFSGDSPISAEVKLGTRRRGRKGEKDWSLKSSEAVAVFCFCFFFLTTLPVSETVQGNVNKVPQEKDSMAK